MDDALLIVRRASPSQLARGFVADLPLGIAALALYYLDRVEGLHPARAPFAFALAFGALFRFTIVSRLAREFVQALRPGLPLTAAKAWFELAPSAGLAALGTWLWAWPLLALARLSWLAIWGVLPLLALRGAIAPSFLARASCADDSGVPAWTRAIDDNRGARQTMLAVESILVAGVLTLFGNLYALSALALLLANSILGLDVGFLRAFSAPDNELVPIVLLAISAIALEPLRAALSALAFADARARLDGADLHAAINALDERTADAPDARSIVRVGKSSALLALLLGLALASPVFAEPPTSHSYQGDARDLEVQARVQHILSRGEFHDFSQADSGRWQILDFIEKLFRSEPDRDRPPPSAAHFQLHLAPPLVVALALAIFILVVLTVRALPRSVDPPPTAAAPASPARTVSLAPPPMAADWSDPNELASAGHYREALRALYRATLRALDRARLIQFAPGRTNGDYVRALSSEAMRASFGRFTAVFEDKWYGAEATSATDYERARALSAELDEIAKAER